MQSGAVWCSVMQSDVVCYSVVQCVCWEVVVLKDEAYVRKEN